MHRGEYKYSRLIGAYVGSGNFAARGVPERFLDPTKQRSTAKAASERTEAALVPKEDAAGPPSQEQSQEQAKPVEGARLVPIEGADGAKVEGQAEQPAQIAQPPSAITSV